MAEPVAGSPVVLIVDDEAGVRESLLDILEDEGYKVATAQSGEEALKRLGEETPDLVFLDVWLPGIDGLDALSKIKALAPELPVVMISGHGNIETAVKATKAGAYDFLEKPLSLDRVLLAASRALERRSLELENRSLRESLLKKWSLIGETPRIKALKGQIALAAASKGRVLITGESGTGKEVVARLLHEGSGRRPFIEVNCAAIPQELIESELFGHEKGSFTGAFEQKKGKFELANGGTLFLDEIADMSLATQAKLLRVLETEQFQRVGGAKNIKVDVRVIAATNKDLEERVSKGAFRDDLYFRINVIPIKLPPLRERSEDIPLLVEHFLDLVAAEYGKHKKSITPEAIDRLMHYDWPGNIRELKNLIERLVIMTTEEGIDTEAIDLALNLTGDSPGQPDNRSGPNSIKEARDAFEKDFITRKLAEHDWNVSKTADAIGIERSNLHRKIKAYGLKGEVN